MQGRDVERTREDLGVWIVECAHCHKSFEAKRSDASYCCSAHRTAHHRKIARMQRRLKDLDDCSTWAVEIARYFPDAETERLLKLIASRCLNAATSIET
jgi:hypothetical protein